MICVRLLIFLLLRLQLYRPALLFLVATRNVENARERGGAKERPYFPPTALRKQSCPSEGGFFPFPSGDARYWSARLCTKKKNDPPAKRICDRDGGSLRSRRVPFISWRGIIPLLSSVFRLSRTRILVSEKATSTAPSTAKGSAQDCDYKTFIGLRS